VQEGGLLNRELSRVIACMGHMDELIVCDAGFPIPDGVDTVDLALSQGSPGVVDVLKVLVPSFSVEKLVVAEETAAHSPTMLANIRGALGSAVPLETLPHAALKARSRTVKAIIRTGEFTAYSNALLVSGPGDRWFVEKK
jgi:D-ribose pyranase